MMEHNKTNFVTERGFGEKCFSISSFMTFSLISLNTIVNVINNLNNNNNNNNNDNNNNNNSNMNVAKRSLVSHNFAGDKKCKLQDCTFLPKKRALKEY